MTVTDVDFNAALPPFLGGARWTQFSTFSGHALIMQQAPSPERPNQIQLSPRDAQRLHDWLGRWLAARN